MRMRHFMAVCLAGLAVSNSVPRSLSACERCRGEHVCSSCQPSNDQGLLDRIDSVLLRRRPRLTPVSIPRLPSLDGSLYRPMAGRVTCRCGSGPDCGCELNEPTCGCELNEPTCGCELNGPTCGCELHQTGRYYTDGQAGSRAAISPQPAHPDEPLGDSYSESYSAPYMPNPPAAIENDGYRIGAPKSLPVTPRPQHQPTEIEPPPDSEVDPFRDESTGRVRRIPARAVQHTQSQRNYRQSYDAQARHEAVRMSLTDDAIGGQPQLTVDSNYARRQNLDANGSSRRRAVEPARWTAELPPEVITASGQQTLSTGRSTPDASYGNNSAPRMVQPQATGVANPLRSNSR
ncbi:MAG: hypothetical protein KDA72_09130 [Planctomycetales bacterium]|nr:hypothetical protein [Planctomycetales bacterium]